jgi:DNA-binding transcriptional LysR family regulator
MDMYPDIKLFTHYHDRFPNMNDEGLDVAVLIGHLPNSSLIARPVGHVRSMVCGSPDYFVAHGEPHSPEDLKKHSLVGTQAFRSSVHWDFQNQGQQNSIRARSRLSCATVQAAISAAAHGAGLTRCLSYPLYEYLNSGRLQRILQPFEMPALPVHVVYRERRKASMRLRSFVDYMVDGLREHPAMRPDSL